MFTLPHEMLGISCRIKVISRALLFLCIASRAGFSENGPDPGRPGETSPRPEVAHG